MSSPIQGKVVAFTGKFSKMTRKEVQSALEGLGAIIGKGVTGKTELLIYGDKAGSKLETAQRLGIEAQNEDWLVALLAGDDPNAAVDVKLTGPLSDYLERVESFVAALRSNPLAQVRSHSSPGVSSATLEKVARDWGLEALPEDIANFYRQTNGLFVGWWPAYHPELPKDFYFPDGVAPSSYMLDSFPADLGGVMWVLPIEEALKKSGGYVDFFYDCYGPDEEREAFGTPFKGEALERSIRLFEFGMNYYPIGFVTLPGLDATLPLVVGDDYGACWDHSLFATCETYLENMLLGAFTPQVRRALYHGATRGGVSWSRHSDPIDLEAMLVEPPASQVSSAEDNFTAQVLQCEALDAQQFRVHALHSKSPSYASGLSRASQVLGLPVKGLSNRELAQQLAEATCDKDSFDTQAGKKICKAFGLKRSSKKAALERLMVGSEEVGVLAIVEVTTNFSATKQQKWEAEHDALAVAKRALTSHDVRGAMVLSSTGRKTRATEVEVLLAGAADIQAGQSFEVTLCPSGFMELDGQLVPKP